MKYYKSGNDIYAHDDEFTFLDFKYNFLESKWKLLSVSINLIDANGIECSEKEIKNLVDVSQLRNFVNDIKQFLF